jgi:hypothetical protein
MQFGGLSALAIRNIYSIGNPYPIRIFEIEPQIIVEDSLYKMKQDLANRNTEEGGYVYPFDERTWLVQRIPMLGVVSRETIDGPQNFSTTII